MMRILQVVHGFPPRQRSGTEVYTYSLCKELARRNEVHLFYPTNEGNKRSLNSFSRDNLEIHELHLPLSFSRGFSRATDFRSTYKNKYAEEGFARLLNTVRPDIIHFQHLINLSASLIEITKSRKIPVVATLHDYWFICPLINLLGPDHTLCGGPSDDCENCLQCWNAERADIVSRYLSKYNFPLGILRGLLSIVRKARNPVEVFVSRKAYMKWLLLTVDRLIAPSKFLRDVFIEYGIPEDKITYSANGYDLRLFDGFKKKEKGKLVFGFAGEVAKHKGVHVLVEAFNRVESENVELRIYGSYDPHSNCFKELQAKIENDKIRFMGRFVDVREPYAEMDVLVVPSIWYETGGPLVIKEAFMAKIPVIASNIGCIPEFVQNNMTGLLFEAGNPDDLYEKIRIIIRNPGLIDRFRENIVAPRSIEDQARELERLYADLKQGINHLGDG